MTSPFEPHDVTWNSVSPRLVTAWMVPTVLSLGIPMIVGLVLALTVTPWFWTLAGVTGVSLLWSVLLIPRQVRAIGYAERDEDLLIRKGVMFKAMVVVPYGRMQYVDVEAGPLDRKLGLAKVQLHTASVGTDAQIPGLPPDEAARLRDRLASRGEARLAGL